MNLFLGREDNNKRKRKKNNNSNNKPETIQAQNVICKLFADLTGKCNRNPFSSQFMHTNDKFVTKRRKFYKLKN